MVNWKLKIRLFDSLRQAILVLGSLFAIGVVWDTFSIQRGFWSFNSKFLVGLTVGAMPIEEYLFIIVVPFLTLTIYGVTKRKR
jgi:lycopene beta-cyclase